MEGVDLSGPEFFRCEKYRCTLLKTVCVARQDKEAVPGHCRTDVFPGCRDCPQGAQIRKEVEMETVKKCRVCGEEKPLGDFHNNKSCKDGHENICKACKTRISRENRRKKREAAQRGEERKAVVPGKQGSPGGDDGLRNLIDAHWAYIESLLRVHGQDNLRIIEYHYKTAFAHGWKHAMEEKELVS